MADKTICNPCNWYKDRKITRDGIRYQVWRCKRCGTEWEERIDD